MRNTFYIAFATADIRKYLVRVISQVFKPMFQLL